MRSDEGLGRETRGGCRPRCAIEAARVKRRLSHQLSSPIRRCSVVHTCCNIQAIQSNPSRAVYGGGSGSIHTSQVQSKLGAGAGNRTRREIHEAICEG